SIMVALSLATGAATIIGVRSVIDDVNGTARQVHVQSRAATELRSLIVYHEEVAQKLLGDQSVDRSAFLREQQEISVLFDRAAAVFPPANGLRAIVVTARESWQEGLMTYGLWGDQVQALHGDHSVDTALFGASSNETLRLLSRLDGLSLVAMDRGLAHGADLERILIIALSALFMLVLTIIVYSSHRMARDLLRPVATMRDFVVRLEAGEYDSQVPVARRDELGDLAEAFNRMTKALRSSHLALTLRATSDPLTGLANRATLTERLTVSFRAGSERRTRHESLLFIDIDDFKDVNDTKGHEGGDALLIQLAGRLNGCVRGQDMVARLGGDEFAIIVMEEDEGGSVGAEVADRVLDALHTPFLVGGESLVVTVSIGVAQRTGETADAAELLRNADFAMYMAKGEGKARYQLFDAQMHDLMVERSALKTDLAVAVASGQLRLEYQPVADLRTGEIVGVEALVRWQHPTLGLLSPRTFIPLAEQTGDIDAIGCWVLETATRQGAAWRRDMDHCRDLWVAINLSVLQLVNPQSLAAIQRTLDDPAAQADRVVLEVTETALAAEVDGGIASLQALKGVGVRIAIDDFGTGFSSLSTLSTLPVDILKIDGSFVSGSASAMPSGTPSTPMLEGILGLAGKLSLTVIAEGIEAPEQLDLLRHLGCDMGQGYLLARPAPAPEVEEMLASGGLLPLGPSADVRGVAGSPGTNPR
ncbi:MAG TPA: EAL domain-containing protein, partial [Dermatophilaceae bacterium]